MSDDLPDDIYLIPDDLTPHKPSAVYTWSLSQTLFTSPTANQRNTPPANQTVLGITNRPPDPVNLKQFNTAKDIVLLCERIIKAGIFLSFSRTNAGPAFRALNPNTNKLEMVYLRGITQILRETFAPGARFHAPPTGTEHITGMLQKFKYLDEESGEMIEEEVFNFVKPGNSATIGHFEFGNSAGGVGNVKVDEGVWYLDAEDGLSLHEKTNLVGSSTGSADSMERGRQVHAILDWYKKSYIHELKRGTLLLDMAQILKDEVETFTAKSDFDRQNIEIASKIIDVYNLPELQILPICSELPVFTASRLKSFMRKKNRNNTTPPTGNSDADSLYGTPIDALGYSIVLGCLVVIEIKTTKCDILKGSSPMTKPFNYMRDSFQNQTILQLDVGSEQFEQTYGKELMEAGIPLKIYSLAVFASPIGTLPAEWTLQTPKERKVIIDQLKRSRYSFLVK